MSQRTAPFTVHLALFAGALIYAIFFSIAKGIMPHYLRAEGFIVLRIGSACLLYWLTHFLLIREKVQRKHLVKLAVCAFFGVAANMTLFFKGVEITRPINGAVLMLCSPIFVVLIGTWYRKDKLRWQPFAGIALAAVGAVSLMAGGKLDFNAETLPGDIMVTVNAILYAVYLVLVRDLLNHYNAITVNRITFSFGFLMVLPVGFGSLSETNFAAIPAEIWWQIAYVLVFTTFVVYQLNAYAIKYGGSSVTASYIYLQPVLTGLIAVLWGTDHMNLQKLLSSLLIFAGVYLVNTKPRT